MLTYQDYLRYVEQNGLQGAGNYSEQDWNRLSPDRQWANVGGGLMLHNSDPRYQEYAGLLGEKDPGRYLMAGPSGDWDSSWMLDPNRMVSRNGVNVSTSGNESPQSQARNDFGLVQYGWAVPLGAAAIAAMTGGGGLLGGESLANTGMVDTLGAGAAENGFAGANMGAWGGTPGASTWAGTFGEYGGLDPETWLNNGGLPNGSPSAGLLERIVVDGSRLPPEVNPNLFNPIPPVIPSTFNPTLDPAPEIKPDPNGDKPFYQPLLDNPIQSLIRGAGLFQMTRGLFDQDRGNKPAGNDNNGDPGKGGTGTAPQFQRGTYQPNAITQAQLDNFKFARPRGY